MYKYEVYPHESWTAGTSPVPPPEFLTLDEAESYARRVIAERKTQYAYVVREREVVAIFVISSDGSTICVY